MGINLIEKYRQAPVPLKASFWYLVCTFGQKVISVVTTPILTRLMSTKDYGNVSVFNSWSGVIAIVVTLYLCHGIYSQGLVKFEEDRKAFSSSMQGLLLALCLVWYLLYVLFHSVVNRILNLTTLQMTAMFVGMWSSSVFVFWATEQRVDYKYKKLVAVSVSVSLINAVAGIVTVANVDDKATGKILSSTIVMFFGYVGLFVAQVSKGKKIYSRKYWKYAVSFAIPLIPHYLSQTVLNSADRIMIKSMVGAGEAGIYSLAYSVSQILLALNIAILNTLSPWIFKKIKSKKVEDISGVAYPALIGVALANTILISVAPELVALFAPKAYYDAIWIIPPVAMSVFFIFSYSLFADFEFYFEKKNFLMMASVIAAVLNVILNYIFIGKFGYYAAGYTTLFCYVVYAIGHYLFMKKICSDYIGTVKVYDEKILISIAVVFMFAGFVFLSLYRHLFLRYILIVIIISISIVNRKKIEKYIRIIKEEDR
jgi:O-antigen/teichoic acid export membrane protein